MRRSEREVTDPALLVDILDHAAVLFLALPDEPAPYVLPLCFGYNEGTIYVHSAPSGTKIDMLRAHPRVGFSACSDMVVVPGADACGFTSRAESVVGTGLARFVESEEEKSRGLDAIMRHYASGPQTGTFAYRPGPFSRTCVVAIAIESLSGKRIG